MSAFKFKAQAALDLRQRQDDEAQQALADAVRARLDAETKVGAASVAVDESIHQASEALKSAASPTLHRWHRNWIASRRQELGARRAGLAQCRAAEQLARQRAQKARRALRMLERWCERAARREQAQRRRREQQELDAVGALQYVTRQRAQG